MVDDQKCNVKVDAGCSDEYQMQWLYIAILSSSYSNNSDIYALFDVTDVQNHVG